MNCATLTMYSAQESETRMILRVELDHLRFVLEIVPVGVLGVAQRAEFLDRTPAPHRGGYG